MLGESTDDLSGRALTEERLGAASPPQVRTRLLRIGSGDDAQQLRATIYAGRTYLDSGERLEAGTPCDAALT